MAALQTFGPGTLGGLGTFGPGTFSGGTPLRRWMVPGRCGCCTCTYFFDRFTRADNADLGDDWDEQLGTWSIENYRAKTTSSNARLICTAVDTPDEDPHVVSAALRGMGVGDQPRLISSKVTGQDTYWFFEMTYAATTVDLKLYQRTDGSDVQRGSTTTLYNMAPRIPLALRIAFDESEICAQYRRITDTIWTTATSYETTGITDPICGAGTGTVNNEVRVDDFRLEKHGSLYPGCPKCSPDCLACEGTMPNEFLIVPTGPIGDLGLICRRILPQNGYVVKRSTWNPCVYMHDLEPPVIVPPDDGFYQWLLAYYGWFGDYGNTPISRVVLVFLPNWGDSSLTLAQIGFLTGNNPVPRWSVWRKAILSTRVCSDLSAETGFTGGESPCMHIDWEVTAL